MITFLSLLPDQPQSSDSRRCSAITGSGRKLKDNAADWHNLILRWEKLNNEGSGVAEKIVDQRLKRFVRSPPQGLRALEIGYLKGPMLCHLV